MGAAVLVLELGKFYCCHRLGKAVRMLTGALTRKLCVQWTLEVFLQEKNIEVSKSSIVSIAEKLVL